MTEIINKFKKTPGPMTYKPGLKKKPLSKVQSKVPKAGRMGEIEYLARETPGVGKYDLNKSLQSIEAHEYHVRIKPDKR